MSRPHFYAHFGGRFLLYLSTKPPLLLVSSDCKILTFRVKYAIIKRCSIQVVYIVLPTS